MGRFSDPLHFLGRKNMQGSGSLMGSFRTPDIEELVALHMGCLGFLPPILLSQANMSELISNKTIGTRFSCQNGANFVSQHHGVAI